MTSRYGAAILFVFKAQRRAHSAAYVTGAATPKTSKRASQIGKSFFDGPLASRLPFPDQTTIGWHHFALSIHPLLKPSPYTNGHRGW